VTTLGDLLQNNMEREEAAKRVFNSMDADGDGTLSYEEFREAFSVLHQAACPRPTLGAQR
jgi:Ca2+-binding EF-hand superfamily protein